MKTWTAILLILAIQRPGFAASAPTFKLVRLPLDEANGLNDRGAVIGTRGGDGFLWMDGHLRKLKSLWGRPREMVVPRGINNHGVVVGHVVYTESGGISTFEHRAFLWKDGRMKELRGAETDRPPDMISGHGLYNMAFGINDSNNILGYVDGIGIWRPGSNTHFTSVGLVSAGTYDEDTDAFISDRGQIAGMVLVDTRTEEREYWPVHAALWTRGKIRDLGTLGGLRSRPRAIDSLGRVVGRSETAGGSTHAFVYRAGKMRDLGTVSGLPNSEADGVSSNGWIVGTAWSQARSEGCLWIHSKPIRLSSCVHLPLGWWLSSTTAVNCSGWILAKARRGEESYPCLLIPARKARSKAR